MLEENKPVKQQTDPVVLEMESKYPEMTKEFKKIMRIQYETFCKKMLDYGTDNIALGKDLSNEEDRRLSQMGNVNLNKRRS